MQLFHRQAMHGNSAVKGSHVPVTYNHVRGDRFQYLKRGGAWLAVCLTLALSACGGGGGSNATAVVNVTDQTAPVIVLTGANPMAVAQGSVFTDQGSTVSDNVDTGLTTTVTGSVDTAAVGTYTLTYNVSDAAGNAATAVTRTVNVIVVLNVSIAPASVPEGSGGGATNLNFTVTLSAASTAGVTVSYATTDGTALAASDYTAGNGTLTIPIGSTSGTITVLVNADTIFEPNEMLTLTLSTPIGATLATAVATGTILNDDVGGMNDTGIIQWGDVSVNNLTVTQTLFPGQDADHGRDARAKAGTLTKVGASTNANQGFDFTKLNAAGVALTNQAVAYATTPWSCVQDNVTGLMWEAKTTTGLHNANHTYSWYNSIGANDGGNPGIANNGNSCVDTVNCDTEKYVAAVNVAALCGFSDWRLPEIEALRSIVDYSIGFPGPAIDTAYFPNNIGDGYWSSSPYAVLSSSAWYLRFGSAVDTTASKAFGGFHVRLVRGGL